MKHKHSELIKAWADGAEIEYKCDNKWYAVTAPGWYDNREYRIKPKVKPEWQQKLIDAVRIGKIVEWNVYDSDWINSAINGNTIPDEFNFENDSRRYRIKPESISRWQWIVRDKISGLYRVDPGLYTEEEVHAKFGNSPYYTLIAKAETTEVIFDA